LKTRQVFLSVCLILVVCTCGCLQIISESPRGKDQYLGRTPPGLVPEVFAPGIVSSPEWAEHCQLAVSPQGNEIVWSAWSSKYPSAEGRNTEQIYFSRFRDGAWSEPALVEFVKDNLQHINGGPVFAPDGNRLYFYGVDWSGGLGTMDTWYVDKVDGEWGSPVNAGEPYNTQGADWTPSFTARDRAYRFAGKPLCFDYQNGLFADPDTMQINPDYRRRFPFFVAPDESYAIFASDHAGGYGGLDLYFSAIDQDGIWGPPHNLGEQVNTSVTERMPMVSPDGKYLFFVRHTPSQDFFWVSTDILEPFRAADDLSTPWAYLGQTPPDSTALLFAPELIQHMAHSSPTFTPDGREIYWSTVSGEGESRKIYQVSFADGEWSESTVVSFSGDYHSDHPFIAPDGQTMYFASKRPKQVDGPEENDLWFMERSNGSWSEPRTVNDLIGFWTPVITRTGVLYCMDSTEEHGRGLYRAESTDGVFAAPEFLPEQINHPDVLNWCPYIAPDESYLLFSSHREGGNGSGDLYVCFRDEDGRWSAAINLGEAVNTDQQERFPGVSPDGKYLFFTRFHSEPYYHDLYWISADIILSMKP
jgi:Tol biopolymer transport system component